MSIKTLKYQVKIANRFEVLETQDIEEKSDETDLNELGKASKYR